MDNKQLFSVRVIVATGIGAAIFFVLMRFVAIPSGIPNTNLALAPAILTVFAAIFGPVCGVLIGFIGHTLTDLTWGSVWWSWVIANAAYGLLVGLFWKFYKIEEGSFGVKEAVVLNVVQIVANAIVWIGVAPVLDILMMNEPADKVFAQGLMACALNTGVCLILGTLLVIGYARTVVKPGSLSEE